MKENWRTIDGYEDYQVSNFGRVKSLKNGKEKILRPRVNGKGYLDVILCKDRKRKHMTVHRLVANAFLQNPDNLPVINHIDENKQNNFVSNLEWCTYSYNNSYNNRAKKIGEQLTNGPLSKQVGQFSLDGQLIKIWPSMMEAARNGFNKGHICSCCQGRLKTNAGFIWKYIE